MRQLFRNRVLVPLQAQLTQGVSPSRLALALTLGLVLGVVPVLGVTTGLCAAVAVALRLNQPAIHELLYDPPQKTVRYDHLLGQLTRSHQAPAILGGKVEHGTHRVIDFAGDHVSIPAMRISIVITNVSFGDSESRRAAPYCRLRVPEASSRNSAILPGS